MQGEHRDELNHGAIPRARRRHPHLARQRRQGQLQATELLASITHADVAASIDDTGGNAAGGGGC
jgi:hypothetical protein